MPAPHTRFQTAPVLPPKPAFASRPQLCADGLILGKGTVIAQFINHSETSGLALQGREEHVLALLSIASGKHANPAVLRKLESASRALARGEPVLATFILCQTDLPRLANDNAADALEIAARRLENGVSPAPPRAGDWANPSFNIPGWQVLRTKHCQSR